MESKVVGALTTALCIEHSPVVSVATSVAVLVTSVASVVLHLPVVSMATSLAVLVTSVASVVSYSIFFNAEKL